MNEKMKHMAVPPVPYFKVHYFSKNSMGAAIKPRRVKAWKQKIE